MSYKFECSFCGQKLEAEEGWVGMQLECPSCNGEIIVPQPAATPRPPPLKDQPIKKSGTLKRIALSLFMLRVLLIRVDVYSPVPSQSYRFLSPF